MKPIGIQHVSIGVHDLVPAIEFYGWLGMTVVASRPNFSVDGAWLQAAGQQVHLIVTDSPHPGSKITSQLSSTISRRALENCQTMV